MLDAKLCGRIKKLPKAVNTEDTKLILIVSY